LLGSGSKPFQLFGLRKTPELSLALITRLYRLWGVTGSVPATGGFSRTARSLILAGFGDARGVLVFVNLQAAFLSPPVAMSAFYLKGVSPPHVTLNQIFSGMMPYMLIVIVCMVFMYLWPGMTLWLPTYLYGN
jgi:hypothetical protein